jgi:ribose 5-phosphate isomerase B
VLVAFGTDEITPTTDAIVGWLRDHGHAVSVLEGTPEWPEVGRLVGEAVAAGQADRGVVCCFTGTGVSIAANKVPGVRAALCTDAATAAGARRWNDANVLAIGLRLASPTVALEAVEAFLSAEVEPAEVGTVGRLEGPGAPGAP